jgi:hypothetical protein
MTIIKQTDIHDILGNSVQDLRENPLQSYRELLSAPPPPGHDADHLYAPYSVTVPAGTRVVVRIPHAMSIGSLGVAGQAAAAANARVPDVVIPVQTANLNTPVASVEVRALIDGSGAVSPTGGSADKDYVYLVLFNHDTQSAHDVQFLVYIEYTHSIITNEAVTGVAADVTP